MLRITSITKPELKPTQVNIIFDLKADKVREELDDILEKLQPPKYIKKNGKLYIEGHEDFGPVGFG